MMYTILDVKKACTKLLRQTFPNITVYDADTFDGYVRPSFFTEIRTRGRRPESALLRTIGFVYTITYFETTHDEAECLRIYEAVCSAFGHAVRVFEGSRTRVVVESISYQWVGENLDKMQIEVRFRDAVELGGATDDYDKMEQIDVEYTQEEA